MRSTLVNLNLAQHALIMVDTLARTRVIANMCPSAQATASLYRHCSLTDSLWFHSSETSLNERIEGRLHEN